MLPEFKKVNRSTLYYNRWQYVVNFRLLYASCLREFDHRKITESVVFQNMWRGSSGRPRITDEELAGLKDISDYFKARAHPFKKVVSGNSLSFYTNDPEDFEDYRIVPNLRLAGIDQANLVFSPGVVTLVAPQHAFRTYFKERWIRDAELENVRRYFTARKHMFRLGPGFKQMIDGKRIWITSNHFVDHNEPNADFLINLALPGLVRKTLPIVGRAK